MLRVDTRRVTAGALELLVSGTLDAGHVPVIRHAVLEAEALHHGVVLNLGGLVGVDRVGCQALIDLTSHGTRLLNCPPFVRRWIRDERQSRIHDRS
ncbi:MAG: hypothetical protein NTY02_02115 [Acidobacteria bacterium]|nr:hypothetical protein [Acidobacteriota bacterium]